MKRLADLAPKFVTENGRRTGVSFACPKCGDHRVFVYVEPPFDPGPPLPSPWKRTGDDFETLTLSPSVVARRPGQTDECWHGFVQNGAVTP